jgi:hypothetical protein
MWQPIETAPKDNKRPLWLARFNDDGTMQSFDYNGSWESESESWEMPQVYYYWASESGNVEEPSHWAYQPEGFCVLGAQPAQRMNMQTADQITQAFKAELQALLDKYGAELSARDTWEGYPECGEDVRMHVDVPAIYDADHNCLREYTEIDLGSWVQSTQAMPKEFCTLISAPSEPSVPEGWKLVPIEPTVKIRKAMHYAYWKSPQLPYHDGSPELWNAAYAAMLAAAPEAKP